VHSSGADRGCWLVERGSVTQGSGGAGEGVENRRNDTGLQGGIKMAHKDPDFEQSEFPKLSTASAYSPLDPPFLDCFGPHRLSLGPNCPTDRSIGQQASLTDLYVCRIHLILHSHPLIVTLCAPPQQRRKKHISRLPIFYCVHHHFCLLTW
jgi:hypothetical protein